MTNTETCMREMRHIIMLFMNSNDNFDGQWILFKAYLNTVHSLSDNDKAAKANFINNELINFVLVLRNVIHHQPAKWHFGKHDVWPTGMTLNFSADKNQIHEVNLTLVIQKRTLEDKELQKKLANGSKGTKQLDILNKSLDRITSPVIIISELMKQTQVYIESYCRENNQYTETADKESLGYNLIKNA